MELSRRKFTKEFKEEAVRRLELGASIAEVARACELTPNVLHRWRRDLRDYGASPNWSAKSGARRWRSIFCGDACSMSRSSGSCRRWLRTARLPIPPERNEVSDADSAATAMPVGPR